MSAEKKHYIFIAFCCCLLVAPGVLCTCAGGTSTTLEITARVPLIAYNITAIEITKTTANITWMTNGVTNSTVEYGAPDYTWAKNDSDMVISHRITLEGLSGGQEYHYRVISYDSVGTNFTSADFTFTTPNSKSLVSNSGGGGGGGFSTIGNLVGMPAVELLASPPALTIVSGDVIPLTADNLVAEPVVIVSSDRSAYLSIDTNTRLLDQYGQPLSNIDLTRIAIKDVPAVPKESLFEFAGYAYQIEPSGATFSPPIALKITITPEEWKQISGQELSIQYYNPVSGLWEALSTTTDPATYTVITMIGHASDYGLFIRPASPMSPSISTTEKTTLTLPGPVRGSLVGFNWLIVLQSLALIMIIIVVSSTGLYFYRKKNGP
jgi:hypothetical protein